MTPNNQRQTKANIESENADARFAIFVCYELKWRKGTETQMDTDTVRDTE